MKHQSCRSNRRPKKPEAEQAPSALESEATQIQETSINEPEAEQVSSATQSEATPI